MGKALADLVGWKGRVPYPPPAKIYSFSYTFREILSNSRLTPPLGVGTPWEILDPPLGRAG